MCCCYAISIYGRSGELLIAVHEKYLGGKRVNRAIMVHYDQARYKNPCENREYFLENSVKES